MATRVAGIIPVQVSRTARRVYIPNSYPSGYFGATPLVVSGTITTRVPPFARPLPVRAVYAIVRCTETRGSHERVVWEKIKTIWSSEDYVVIGAWSHPFRVSVPPEVARATSSSLCFKEWKSVWKFDIALEHEPIPYVGHRLTKSFHLNVRNHSQPYLPAPLASDFIVGTDSHATNVQISPPHGAFGPEDNVDVAVRAKPVVPSTAVKKAIMVLERVVDFLEQDKSAVRISPKTESTEVSTIAFSTVDATELDGWYRCCLAVKLPKRTAKWDVGETVRTQLVSIRYQLRIKITTKSSKSRLSRDWTCDPIPVTISATSIYERAQAKAAAPVKLRKHKSSRRGLYMHEGTVDISSDAVNLWKRSTTSLSPPSSTVRPILLPPDHPAQSQSISFIFPSPPPHTTNLQHPGALPSLESLFPDAPEPSWSTLQQFQQTGRRISTTASEEEAMQPSRTKQRTFEDPRLPSLDSLGLGLQSDSRRPMTAPALFSSASFTSPPAPYTSPVDARPRTSAGSSQSQPSSNMLSPHTFAFTVNGD
jgi:hypothetical protein